MRHPYCAILNVTERGKVLGRILGYCAIINVTEAKGAFNYGESVETGVFG